MAEKQVNITTMVIKVDLACEKCRMKIKKVLCEIYQIQNQIYDEKKNIVTITVLCCSPEKIKQKIYCRGGEAVKCIEIIKPKEKPKETTQKPKDEQTKTHKPDCQKPIPNQPKSDSPKLTPIQLPKPVPVQDCCGECYQGIGGGPCYHGHGRPTSPCFNPKPMPKPDPKLVPPQPPSPVPVRDCCGECYQGIGGGPCYDGYGRPTPQCLSPKPTLKLDPKPVLVQPPSPVPVRDCCSECYQGIGGGPCYHDCGRPTPLCLSPKPKPTPKPNPKPVPVQPPTLVPFPVCCSECYQGIGGGPCYHGGYRPRPPSFEAYGRPVYDSWGGGCSCRSRGYYVCRCEHVYDNNAASCTII